MFVSIQLKFWANFLWLFFTYFFAWIFLLFLSTGFFSIPRKFDFDSGVWGNLVSRMCQNPLLIINIIVNYYYYENYDIASAMSSSRADPVLGHCPGWGYCQAPSQIPNPQGQAPTQSNPVKISSKGTGADTKILWATHHHHPTPKLLSMKEASNKKTQRVKVT